MNWKDGIHRGTFLMIAAAFFLLPWLYPPARDYAPGVAVIAGVVYDNHFGCFALRKAVEF